MSCCLGSTPFWFWKHLDIIRQIEFNNAFPQIRSRERKFEQRLARGLFWSRLSNLITIPDLWKCVGNTFYPCANGPYQLKQTTDD